MDTYVCLCECMPHVCTFPGKLEEGMRSPGTVVKSGCELTSMDAGNELGSFGRTLSTHTS